MRREYWIGTVLLTAVAIASAQEVPGTTAPSPEDFKIEVSGSLWIVDSSGTASNRTTSLGLVSDLGVHQGVNTFYGRLVYKPGRKHEIVIDGSRFHLDGDHTATKSFTFQGQPFTVSEPLHVSGDLDYLFAGYQYNFLTANAGHLGASVGGALLDATGTLAEPTLHVSATREQKAGMPLVGIEFRIFPVPSRIIDVDGSVRGMDLGGYGYYVESNVNAGIWFARHLGVQAGYRDINAQLHNTGTGSHSDRADGQIRGPIFTAIFKW